MESLGQERWLLLGMDDDLGEGADDRLSDVTVDPVDFDVLADL